MQNIEKILETVDLTAEDAQDKIAEGKLQAHSRLAKAKRQGGQPHCIT